MNNKILLVGTDGEYFVAKKSKNGIKLEPSSKKVYAREVVPYGFDFRFGHNGEHIGICGYGHFIYRDKGKDGKYPEKEEYPRINLDITINALEERVKEKGADYILVDGLRYQDVHTSWDVWGRAQLLIKR